MAGSGGDVILGARGGLRRLLETATLLVAVTLLTLVIWSVTRPAAAPIPSLTGTWVGKGTVYDSSGGGSNRVAIYMDLQQASDGSVYGIANECNDHGQTAHFNVSGTLEGNKVTLSLSGVDLQGVRETSGFIISGSGGGASIQLALRSGDLGDMENACAEVIPVTAGTVP